MWNWRMTTAFLIISLWRITLLKQWGLGELSEIAETLSIVYVKVLRRFIYLIARKHGSRERIAKEDKFKGTKNITPTREKSFLWMEALSENKFYNLQIFLSLRIFSNRIQAYPLLARTQTSCERVMRKFMWL